MMNAMRPLIAFCLVAVVALAPFSAFAQATEAELTVHVVLASKKPGKTDKRLARFKKQFGDFAYQSYQLLSVERAKVKLGESQTVKLAGGKELTLKFTSMGKGNRARVMLSIPDVIETTVAIVPGGDVVLGGPAMPHGDGVLFVPVTLNRLN